MVKVLIVEDDFMIADCLEEILIGAGYDVCGIASNVAEAIALADRHGPDLGVIDVRLADGESGPEAAAALRRRGRFGVLYATGNPDSPLLASAEGEGCIAKPYSGASIVSALEVVHQIMSVGAAPSAQPKGFRLLA